MICWMELKTENQIIKWQRLQTIDSYVTCFLESLGCRASVQTRWQDDTAWENGSVAYSKISWLKLFILCLICVCKGTLFADVSLFFFLLCHQKYPIVWQGLLALKNDTAAVQLHFVCGNKALAHRSLPLQEGGTLLRIVQRMRLEASQLESVARRMTVRPLIFGQIIHLY